jgi:DNA invertase Pin-like site-specific DNA recombinase
MQLSTPTQPKTCFSYVRFSSKKQATGNSEQRQNDIAAKVAEEKGWILRTDLNARDLGCSAHDGSNLKTIESIIEAAKANRIPTGSIMIVEALDRVTRLELDRAFQLFRELLNAGIEIYTQQNGRHLTKNDLNNPFSLMITIGELYAAFEYSSKLSFRVSKAWQHKKARAADKIILTRMAPAWLDVDRANNKFTLNHKADIIQRIFDAYSKGKGVRTIMRELNEGGIPPFGKGRQNKNHGWSSTHILRLLKSRSVIGEYQPYKSDAGKRMPDGAPVEDYYTPAIDKTLFFKVQGILNSPTYTDPNGQTITRKGYASGPKREATNLFTGLVKCAKCGSSMVIKHSPAQHGKYRYVSLVCNDALRGKGCSYHSIQYGWIERAVLSVVWSKVLPAVSSRTAKEQELERLKASRQNCEMQIKKWSDLIDNTPQPPQSALNKVSDYEREQTVLAHRIEVLSATIQSHPLDRWQLVENNPANRMRVAGVLRNEIASLVIDAEKRTAELSIAEPACNFSLAWPKAVGTNRTKTNPANEGFFLNGKKSAYIDNLLVWKSANPLSVEEVELVWKPQTVI